MSDLTRHLHQWSQCAGFKPETHPEGDKTILTVKVFGQTKRRVYNQKGERVE